MGAFVYILECADGSYYVGCATGDDLKKRISEHPGRHVSGLYINVPSGISRLVGLFPADHPRHCCRAEVKGWLRAKKEAFVSGNWDAVR
jgi:putative endonuclease